jgi:putative ABC transport system substrate-binding protein
MRRREFITLLGGAAITWPITVRGQQAAKLPTIGFLAAGTTQNWAPWVAAFAEQLNRLGWVEGRNVMVKYRWAEGHSERFSEIAAEFVRLKVDVIVTGGEPAFAARQATSSIPIVAALMADPVGTSLVTSLAHPGSNVTGLSFQSIDIAGKRVDLLHSVVPQMKRLAVLGNAGNPNVMPEIREVDKAAQKLGLQVARLEVRRAEDILPAFESLKMDGADALYVCIDPLSNANRTKINTLALGARLPTMYGTRDYVETGGLMSYGPSFPTLFRRAAEYVDKILRGAKPGELPIEQPTTFDFVINLTTAKALGLTIPASILSLAELIE